MSELRKLAERCEKATGPDRELDLRIEAAINPEYAGLDEEHARFLTRYGGHPSYTASLDAAMALVPEGWEWSICYGGVVSLKQVVAFCRYPETDVGTRADAATPALAMTAAALRAREEDRG